jgi:hypothetical protein
MYNMWTTHDGPWDAKKAYMHPSSALGTEIDAFEKQLGLMPLNGFPKKAVVTYPNEDLGSGHKIVVVVNMNYTGFKTIGGFHTPLFVFNLTVNASKRTLTGQAMKSTEVVYKGVVNVTFMDNYPRDYPTFKLPKYDGFDGSQHNHHMYTGGRMCLYGDYGHSTGAWYPARSTAAEAFGPAMKWIVWYERDRKRGVDADDINRLQR